MTRRRVANEYQVKSACYVDFLAGRQGVRSI
jgi:hypothetical protein